MSRPLCLIPGFGPGVGTALARRFASAGYDLALLSRSGSALAADALSGATQHAFACDVSDPVALRVLLQRIERDLGPVDTILYNADTAAFGDLETVTEDVFELAWRVGVLGLFTTARTLAPGMVRNGRGNIIISGATASLRGNPQTVAFAPAKSGQRALAQSLAKELGPKGVHVALILIDAVVNTPENVGGAFADKPEGFFIDADSIAANALHLAQQEPSAWTFEMDLRPAAERW